MGSFGYQQNYGGLPEPVCFFSEIEIEGKREKIIFKKNIILIM